MVVNQLSMSKTKKTAIIVLIVLNCVVLSGQVWPQGAPPFARSVNIGFLVLSLFFFIGALIGKKSKN